MILPRQDLATLCVYIDGIKIPPDSGNFRNFEISKRNFSLFLRCNTHTTRRKSSWPFDPIVSELTADSAAEGGGERRSHFGKGNNAGNITSAIIRCEMLVTL